MPVWFCCVYFTTNRAFMYITHSQHNLFSHSFYGNGGVSLNTQNPIKSTTTQVFMWQKLYSRENLLKNCLLCYSLVYKESISYHYSNMSKYYLVSDFHLTVCLNCLNKVVYLLICYQVYYSFMEKCIPSF